MYKKIIAFALFLSIVSFFTAFYNDYNSNLYYVLSFFNYSIAGWIDVGWIEARTLRLFFNFLLFVGVLAYYFSKGKETRLLRFSFATLFVQLCFGVVVQFIFILNRFKGIEVKSYAGIAISYVITFFVLYVLYKSLKYMSEQQSLDFETVDYTESTEVYYFKTGNWERLIHFIIDNLIFLLIGYQLFYGILSFEFVNSYFGIVRGDHADRFFLIIVFPVFSFIYYYLFEKLFSATPGKFLTQSRLVNSEGLVPANSHVLLRTLCRNIPFDGVSFLFNASWHDNLSNTEVFKEKKSEISGAYYFLIIPIFGILLFLVKAIEGYLHTTNI